jgi:Domain of unknown function DUF29
MSDYDDDFYAWTQTQAAALRAQQGEALDWAHLAEEIEDMGASQRHAVVSHLRVLLTHLLKWEYQPQRQSESWLYSMGNAQIEIETYLDENPSLRSQLPVFVTKAYPQARRLAMRETGLAQSLFPSDCPWSPERLLNPDLLDKLA